MDSITSSGIYEILNTVNGHRYVGSTANFGKRWREHKKNLQNNKHRNKHLQSAWNKYGEGSFDFRILENCFWFVLIPREQYYIDTLCPEYNIAPTAGSALGVKRSKETRDRMSEAAKRRYDDPEERIKTSNSQIKRYENPEERAKSVEATKKRYAKNPVTSALKAKMSEIAKKYYAKNPITLETRTKMSAGGKKRWESLEERTKQSESVKAGWARRKKKQEEE